MNDKIYFFIFLALIATISISMPVKGNDVGFINYTSSSTLNYNFSGVTNNVAFNANYVVFNKFILDTGNYTSINTATVYTYDIYVFPKASDYTTFTFTSGATGSGGYVSYVSTTSGGIITYVFNPDMVVTSSQEVILNFATNIFSGTTNNATYNANGFDIALVGTYPLNLSNPFTLTCANVGCGVSYVGASTGADTTPERYITYDVEALANVSVRYNASYFSIGSDPHFNVSITKPGSTQTIPTIVRIQNQTIHTYAEDSALSSTSSFNAFGTYSTGLYANITDSHGDSDTFIINSTGITSPTPTPTPVLNPSTNGGIVWNKNNYSVNEIGTITWLIDSSIITYILTYTYNIRISDNSGEVQRFDNMDVSGLTGTVQYQFPKTGTYTAVFHRDLCTVLGCIEGILDNKSVSVISSPSYLYINSTIPSQIAFNATYIFGTTPAIQGELNSIIIEFLGANGYEPISTTSLGNNNIVGGTSYNVSLIVPKPGTYRFTLFDISKGKLVSTLSSAVDVFIPPTQHITTSLISVDKSTYYFGESILVSYAYDDYNYSNYQKFFSLNNTGNGIYTFPGTALYSQIDIFELPISSGSVPGYCSKSTNLGCFITSTTQFYAGNNTLNLMVKNSTSNFSVAHVNFTISNVNLNGYGFPAPSSPVCTGETLIVRSSGNGTINVTLRQPGTTYKDIILYKSWNTTGNNQTRYLKLTLDGDYEFALIDQSGNTQFNYYVRANSCATPTPTSAVIKFPGQNGTWTPTQTSITNTCSYWDGWVQIVFGTQGVNDVTRFEFSALIIASLLGFTAIITRSLFNGIAVGFFPYAFFLYLSLSTPCGQYIPIWTGIFIALIIAAKLKWF